MANYYVGSMTFSDGSDILHYGVKGMKWGVRNEAKIQSRYKRLSSRARKYKLRSTRLQVKASKAQLKATKYGQRSKIAIEPEVLMNKTKRANKLQKRASQTLLKSMRYEKKAQNWFEKNRDILDKKVSEL